MRDDPVRRFNERSARQSTTSQQRPVSLRWQRAPRWVIAWGVRSPWPGYVGALLGVVLISAIIGLIQAAHTQIANISMLYLLPVLALAVFFGRGPAVLASLLSFVAFDYFFVPPLHVLTVTDAYAWLSLVLLLLTALVTGQLTATLRLQAREARQREQQTATLYGLAQLIAAGTDLDTVLRATAERVVRVFAPAGARASMIALPEPDGRLRERATASETRDDAHSDALGEDTANAMVAALRLDDAECAALARRVLEQEIPLTRRLPGATATEDENGDAEIEVLLAPLRSGGQTVGILGVAGDPGIGARLAGDRPVPVAASAAAAVTEPADVHPHAPTEDGGAASHANDGARSEYVYTSPAGGDERGTRRRTRRAAEGWQAWVRPYGYRPYGYQQTLTALFDAFRGQIALAIERANLEAAAVHAEALRESDRLKDALLGTVTHDLRTPLASIKAITTSLLRPETALGERERHELIETVDASVDRLNRLVSNLLDLSRLEAGVAEPQRDWYLIGDAVATVLERLELAGLTSGRRIGVDLPPDLPLVRIDHEQIEQVLTNLIENAVKYSPPQTPVDVSARVAASGAELEVRVSDEGIGIPVADREAIFDKFYRVQRPRLPWASARASAGTGLGLAICRAIVRAHGGRIWAKSRPGHGTTLAFTLPLASDAPSGELPEVTYALDERAPEPAEPAELPKQVEPAEQVEPAPFNEAAHHER